MLRDQWIRDSEGYLIVYSIRSRSSFRRVQEFYDEIVRVKYQNADFSITGLRLTQTSTFNAHFTPTMLVGNHCDQETEREVPTDEGADLAEQLGCEFVEASVKDHVNVEKAFHDVVRMIRQQRNDRQ